MRFAPMVALCLTACTGPAVTDAELCRDVIRRLCAAPRCAEVDAAFGVGDTCEATLLTRSGCAAETFSFATPDRNRVLSCRLPLIRQGDRLDAHPACIDVLETLDRCPDLTKALGGIQ
ncbi:MAG: hypothetical protein K1X89_31935 [Myxococcaceae bacterium]|nr:hypothetical protein [Myxococcaceae bacterium]